MRQISILALAVVLLAAAGCGPGELKEFSSADGKYKILLYANPTKKDQQASGQTVHVVANDMGSKAIMVMHTDLPIKAEESAEQIAKRLDGAKTGAMNSVKAKETKSAKITIKDKAGNEFPGREFTGELPSSQGVLKSRIFIVGKRLYQVLVFGPASFVDSGDVARVFDSFELTN
jgi:hypothetical protein